MAFTEQQLSVINSHFRLDDLGELDGPTITIEVNKREARLLVEALDTYRETMCPLDGKDGDCAMVFWSESVHTGAAEKNCVGRCDRLIEELLGEKAQKAFKRDKR